MKGLAWKTSLNIGMRLLKRRLSPSPDLIAPIIQLQYNWCSLGWFSLLPKKLQQILPNKFFRFKTSLTVKLFLILPRIWSYFSNVQTLGTILRLSSHRPPIYKCFKECLNRVIHFPQLTHYFTLNFLIFQNDREDPEDFGETWAGCPASPPWAASG